MNHSSKRLAAVLAATALTLGLAACNKADDNQTAGQKLDNAIERTEQAADNAKEEADRAAETAGQKLDNAADAVQDAADSAGITTKVNAALVGDPELSALKIDVDTKDGAVTLSGTAPTQTAKDRATEIAQAVEGVVSVNNLLTVTP